MTGMRRARPVAGASTVAARGRLRRPRPASKHPPRAPRTRPRHAPARRAVLRTDARPAYAHTAPAAAPAAGHRRISGRQRLRMQYAILSGVRGLLSSAALLCRGAASSGADLSAGLLAAAGGLYTYALEEYGKLLLLDSLPEKGGIVSVPLLEMFRRHGKKFGAALDSLPEECRLLGGGPTGPRLPCAEPLEATFPGRTSMLYTDIGRNGEPSAPRRPDAKMLEKALRGLDRAVAEREARRRRGEP